MDDHVQVRSAVAHLESSLEPRDEGLSVSFQANEESCTFQGFPNDDRLDLVNQDTAMIADKEEELENSCTPLETSQTVSIKRYSTVSLKVGQKKSPWRSLCPSCYNFFASYRSHNPEEKVTPFALIILLVLFLIYVLNQADRLVLAVSIPAGLRCESSIKSQCLAEDNLTNSSNISMYNGLMRSDDDFINNMSNSSNIDEDCIHFTDEEQGLLTGKYCKSYSSLGRTKLLFNNV